MQRSRVPVFHLVIVLLALAPLACGGGKSDAPSAATDTPSAPSQASIEPTTGQIPLPAVGTARAWLEEGGLVSVLANAAPRGAIVSALSEATGFALVLGEQTQLDSPLTLRAEREPIEVVLARVLAGVPYALGYADDASGARRLARLTLGTVAGAAPSVAAAAPRMRRRERPDSDLSPDEVQQRAEQAQKMWAESLQNVESHDPGVRVEALGWLNVDSAEGFQAATDRLANDEAPTVRVAAAEALGSADTGAVQPLLQALNDPDPSVVLAALDSLEFVGDESTVQYLTPLLKHKDVAVRERTVEAIDFLQ